MKYIFRTISCLAKIMMICWKILIITYFLAVTIFINA